MVGLVGLLKPPYWSSYSKPRLWLHTVVSSKYFDLGIAAVIGVNVVTMAIEHYNMPTVTCCFHSARVMYVHDRGGARNLCLGGRKIQEGLVVGLSKSTTVTESLDVHDYYKCHKSTLGGPDPSTLHRPPLLDAVLTYYYCGRPME